MSAGFLWYWRRNRRQYRRKRCRSVWDWRNTVWELHPLTVTVLVAAVVAWVLIGMMEERLRPVLLTAARIQTQNELAIVLEESVLTELEQQGLRYVDLVTVERNGAGSITAITTNMAGMNRLRGAVMERLLDAVDTIDESAIAIPIGSLIESELLWGRGPTIKVQSFAVGTVKAEFESEFASAGVNQTLHKIWLQVSVPATVLLPGTQMEVSVDTRICVAETVIVGQVPNYVQRAI